MSLANLPGHSRVWTFFSNRHLTINEVVDLDEKLTAFVSDWKAHGNALFAGYEIIKGVAVVIAVDETVAPPTGCSIDKAFRLLQEFGAEHQIDFFNRLLVITASEAPVILNKDEAKLRFEQGRIFADTLVYNSLIENLETFSNSFVISFSRHWLGKQLGAGIPSS